MSKYVKIIDEDFKSKVANGVVKNKLHYMGSELFDFTTYDNDLDELFAKKMLEVIEAICTKTNTHYISQSEENYHNFILMCNTAFLRDKLDWGTSIRTCFFDCAFYTNEPYEISDFEIPREDLALFFSDLLTWFNAEP